MYIKVKGKPKRIQHSASAVSLPHSPAPASLLDIYNHLLVYIRIAHNRTEFIKRYLAILILVRKADCLVHNLLQLRVFQIVANHHFEYLLEKYYK